MAAERLSMRQIREILRQKWALRLPHRAVAQSLGLGLGTISSVLTRAAGAGLDWSQVQTLTDDALESRLYRRPEVAGQRQRPAPDCAWIHAERRRAGVTLELLHLEYLERPLGSSARELFDRAVRAKKENVTKIGGESSERFLGLATALSLVMGFTWSAGATIRIKIAEVQKRCCLHPG
jgi:hypothetical protein